MSTTPVAEQAAQAAQAERRVREQVRDAAALMLFSGALSGVVAGAALVLSRLLGAQGR